jgi:hypothetical protein
MRCAHQPRDVKCESGVTIQVLGLRAAYPGLQLLEKNMYPLGPVEKDLLEVSQIWCCSRRLVDHSLWGSTVKTPLCTLGQSRISLVRVWIL